MRTTNMTADLKTLGKSGHFFNNWANTYSCKPDLYFEPESTSDIKKILSSASAKGKKVKVIGCGHSPSDLACTTDYMISLRRYNNMLKVMKDKNQIQVEAGMLLQDLNEILERYGMALSVIGSVADLTIGGTISTATHGTGAKFGNISSAIVSMDIMTHDGEIITVSQDENPNLFPAVRCSLGALGVILSITIQCEPAFKLQQNKSVCKLDDVLENLNVQVTSSEHFHFHWIPHTDSAITYHSNRTKKPIMDKTSWLWDIFFGYYILEFLYWISTFSLFNLIPRLHRFILHLNTAPRERVNRSDKIFTFDCLYKQHVMEWAIPRDKCALVLKELQDWFENSQYPAHSPIEVRFTKGDHIYLSPAYGQDTCYINIIMYRPYGKDVPTEAFWQKFQFIVSQVGGRPHWAKDHTLNSDDFRKLYPKWQAFCDIRQKLDPNGMFLNDNLRKVFGK